MLKRWKASGFAGIDDTLLHNEKTAIWFGDAKRFVSGITADVQAL